MKNRAPFVYAYYILKKIFFDIVEIIWSIISSRACRARFFLLSENNISKYLCAFCTQIIKNKFYTWEFVFLPILPLRSPARFAKQTTTGKTFFFFFCKNWTPSSWCVSYTLFLHLCLYFQFYFYIYFYHLHYIYLYHYL